MKQATEQELRELLLKAFEAGYNLCQSVERRGPLTMPEVEERVRDHTIEQLINSL